MAGNMLYGDINPEVAGYYAKRTLERGLPIMPLEPHVSGKALPANETKTIRFRRYEGNIQFAKDNMYLTEGVTPNKQALAMQDYVLTLRQMGGLIGLSDIINDTHPDQFGNESFDILGEQAPRVIETDRFYALRAATNKYYSGTATARSQVVATIQKALLNKITRAFKRNFALQITRIAKTDPDFNTVSIRPAYVAACHTDLEYDIQQIPGFKEIADYPAGTELMVGEIGSVGDFRFVLGQDLVAYPDAGAAVAGTLSTSGTNSDVYPIFIFGQKAWDSVAFKGQFAVTPTVINPIPSKSDPLGQTGSVGWKTMQGTLITNQAWCAVVECAATAL